MQFRKKEMWGQGRRNSWAILKQSQENDFPQ